MKPGPGLAYKGLNELTKHVYPFQPLLHTAQERNFFGQGLADFYSKFSRTGQ